MFQNFKKCIIGCNHSLDFSVSTFLKVKLKPNKMNERKLLKDISSRVYSSSGAKQLATNDFCSILSGKTKTDFVVFVDS